jgi:hypothetical protein
MPNLAMEAIWVDQSRESDRIESSPWHKHFLEATNGATKFHGFVVSTPIDWTVIGSSVNKCQDFDALIDYYSFGMGSYRSPDAR